MRIVFSSCKALAIAQSVGSLSKSHKATNCLLFLDCLLTEQGRGKTKGFVSRGNNSDIVGYELKTVTGKTGFLVVMLLLANRG